MRATELTRGGTVDNQPVGTHLMQAAIALVVDVLREHPEGITNRDIGIATGLNLAIAKQQGYITWTILQYLLESGVVTKDGRIWKLVGQS